MTHHQNEHCSISFLPAIREVTTSGEFFINQNTHLPAWTLPSVHPYSIKHKQRHHHNVVFSLARFPYYKFYQNFWKKQTYKNAPLTPPGTGCCSPFNDVEIVDFINKVVGSRQVVEEWGGVIGKVVFFGVQGLLFARSPRIPAFE